MRETLCCGCRIFRLIDRAANDNSVNKFSNRMGIPSLSSHAR